MYEGLVKSLRWLGFMFPETHPAQDDADRMSNNIHLYCTQAANAIEELQAQLMYSNDAARAIAEKVPKWIPVTERLPKNLQTVLVVRKDGSIYCWMYSACSPTDEVWVDEYANAFSVYDTTHWMPIPEPPKEES